MKSRNCEARTLQGQLEDLTRELEACEKKRKAVEDDLSQSKWRLNRLEEELKHAKEAAKEAVQISAERERAVFEGMRGELGEEGMLEAALARAREETTALKMKLQVCLVVCGASMMILGFIPPRG